MTDIVERLRAEPHRVPSGLALEAAEEIEMLRRVENDAAEWVDEKTKRLRAEIERLRAALREILDSVAVTASGVEICQCSDFDFARAALGQEGEPRCCSRQIS